MSKGKNKTLAEKLRDLDPRLVYLLLFLTVGITSMIPLGLPMSVSAPTRSLYEAIEAIPDGSVVWYAWDISPGEIDQSVPGMVAMARHLFSKPVKIVFISISAADGPMIYFNTLPELKIPSEKEYGVDYVYMGFVPGGELSVAAVASDLRGTLKTDYYGTPIDSLPVLEGVNTAEDFSLLVGRISSSAMIDSYIRQVTSRYGVNLALLIGASGYPQYIVYYPQTIVGILNGAKGGAEYEILSGFLGKGIAGVDTMSMAHILLLALIVIANIGYFGEKRAKAKGGM